jgi:hypothetical protein
MEKDFFFNYAYVPLKCTYEWNYVISPIISSFSCMRGMEKILEIDRDFDRDLFQVSNADF